MTLFVYKVNSEANKRLNDRFYQQQALYHNTINNLSKTKLMKIAQSIEYAKPEIMKIGNPAKIYFDEEEDLLIALGVKEPEVTATMPE